MKLFCLLLLISTTGLCQTKISGKVTAVGGEGLPQANVIIEDSYDGTSSDQDGNFSFITAESGTKTLVVKYIGFSTFRKEVVLSGQPLVISVQLEEEFSKLDAVTISAGSFTASDASRRTVFKPLDIVTIAGATADIANALNTLPGTQKVGESGRLFVRGGDSYEAKTFIDGMLVVDPYAPSAPNTPSRGRFLPFMFKGTSFSTGGYSAEYGQALSSALALDSKDEDQTTRTDIGVLSVGGDVAHSQAWNGGSAAAKMQYTDIRPYFGLISQRVDWVDAPVSVEGSGAFRQKIGKKGIVKFFGDFSESDFALYNHDIDDDKVKTFFDLNNGYRYVNASYKNALNDNWLIRGGWSYTQLKNNITLGQDLSREDERGLHAKIAAEGSLADRVELKTGIETIRRQYREMYRWYDSATIHLDFDENITAGFAEFDLYASTKFVTRVGARGEYNDLINKFSVDPRVSLAYKTGQNGQVSLAYGIFRQTARNQYVRINHQLAPEKASHYILNYQRIENNRTFRAEIYYKQYASLVKFINGDRYNLGSAGSGYAKGFELFWRDNRSLKNVDYWISYSFLDSKRDYLGFPYQATPNFASAHNFSVVYKHFLTKLKSQVGATVAFTTGRPYNNPNQERFNAGKTPSYQDLSLNWSYLPKPYLILHVSCSNLLGRDNVFGYEYSDVKNSEGIYNSRPVGQPATRFLFIGIFITISKDKSIGQLPSL